MKWGAMAQTTSPTINPAHRQVIESVLEPDEELVWAGRPRQGVVIRSRDLMTVGVVVLFGLVYFWVVGGSLLDDPTAAELIFHLLVLVFVVYFAIGSFFVDAYYRSRLYYALTNNRAIILNTMVVNDAVSILKSDFFLARLSETAGGRGTIRLDSPTQAVNSMMLGMGRTHAAFGHPPMFFEVEDAQAVFDLIKPAK